MKAFKFALLSGIPAAILVSPLSAAAQETPSNDGDRAIGDIVVTAQRRAEPLQKTPLAISAIAGDNIGPGQVQKFSDLQGTVPNLSISLYNGAARANIRGIGLEQINTGAEGSIAINQDGVFISRPAVGLSGFYDVERVEVLRGPQGTIQGRNATGGAINIISRAPTEEFSGYARLNVGNYSRIGTEAAISGALVPDVLSARLAVQTEDRDGYGRNLFTGNDVDDARTRAARLSLLLRASENADFRLTADYYEADDAANGYKYVRPGRQSAPGVSVPITGVRLGGQTATDPRDINTEQDPQNHRLFWGINLTGNIELGAVDLKSITAYRYSRYRNLGDLDGTSYPITLNFGQREKARQFSQEFQILGELDRLNYVAGLYYFHEKIDGSTSGGSNSVIFGPGPYNVPPTYKQGFNAGGTLKTDAYAAFVQLTYGITDSLRATAGARYNIETKRIDQYTQFDLVRDYDPANPIIPSATSRDKATFKSFTPRLGAEADLTPTTLLYGSVSKGFKSGTFDLGGLTPAVKPENVWAYEAGVKTTQLNGAVRLNVAGFIYDYSDLQIGKVVGTIINLENAADARIKGIEAELRVRPVKQIEMNFSGALLDAKFRNFVSADPARSFGDGVTFVDAQGRFIPGATAATPGARPAFNLAGNRLSQSPKFSGSADITYRTDTSLGELAFQARLRHISRTYYSPFNRPELSVGARDTIDANITLSRDDGWVVSIYGKNLTDRTYLAGGTVSSGLVGFPINGYYEDPRTYGVSLSYAWGAR